MTVEKIIDIKNADSITKNKEGQTINFKIGDILYLPISYNTWLYKVKPGTRYGAGKGEGLYHQLRD